MKTSYDVVVAGAGITGASAAYWLKKKGVTDVLLIDKGQLASGNTGKSAAIIRTFYSIPLMARLARDAIALFANLEDELGEGRDGGFVQSGFVQLLPAAWVETARQKLAMHTALGIETDFVAPGSYAERFPWLNIDGVGAIVYEPNSGYADPVRTTEAFAKAFEELGGETALRTPCRGLVRKGDRITGVLTDRGVVNCGAVINAAGPWAGFLAESAGLALPLRALREQDTVWQVRTGREASMPDTPVSNPLESTYLRPMGAGRVLIGQGYPKDYADVDPYNFKQTSDNDFEIACLDRMSKRVPALQGARLIDGYAALYDVPPDWMPFFGPRAGIEGYADANGGSGHAFKTGPALTRELVDWIVDGAVADDFARLSYDRVPAGRLFSQAFGGNRV